MKFIAGAELIASENHFLLIFPSWQWQIFIFFFRQNLSDLADENSIDERK